MDKRNIAVLAGGFSDESVISYRSAANCFNNLDKSKFNVYVINIEREKWTWLDKDLNQVFDVDKNSFSLKIQSEQINFDCVLFAIHGPPVEDGKMQAYFDMLGIKYVGSNFTSSCITFAKEMCKQQLYGKNMVNMAKSVLLRTNDLNNMGVQRINDELTYPLFVKPNNNGSSFGVTRVNEASQLLGALEKAFKIDDEVIVEEFIEGTEITCGVFGLKNGIQALPPTEICPETEFFDFEAKYEGKSKEITPARISKEQIAEVQNLSTKLFIYFNLSGFARADFILSKGKFYFLEINTVPGMSNESIIPQQFRAASIDFGKYLGQLIEERIAAN